MKKYIQDICRQTAGMSFQQKLEYIITYYWYHMLGISLAVVLVVFLTVHFAIGEKEPYFSAVLINQPIDYGRDEEMETAFSGYLEGHEDCIVDISSDYNFSYGEVKLEGVNESSYEKFFFRLGGGELDAAIMPESFYRHCLEMDVEFTDLSGMMTGNLPVYADKGKKAAVYAEETGLHEWLQNDTGETLLLVFPVSGTHREACQEFLDFLGAFQEY